MRNCIYNKTIKGLRPFFVFVYFVVMCCLATDGHDYDMNKEIEKRTYLKSIIDQKTSELDSV